MGQNKEDFCVKLSKEELLTFISVQKKIFDIVRLVDVSMTIQYTVLEDGTIEQQPHECYAVWNKNSRCENCISAKALALKSKLTKFEFVNDEIYFVISIYTEVDDTVYMIEMVSHLDDETLFGAYGKNEFIQTIETYNKKLYRDVLTGAYNRRYYHEQLRQLYDINSIVMLDADDFKNINDTYGHSIGDFVLKEIVRISSSCIRSCDYIVRLGGDEFLLLFRNISLEILNDNLKTINRTISSIHADKHPELRVSASIGAVYSTGPAADLIDYADNALYEAKRRKNCIVIKDLSSQ